MKVYKSMLSLIFLLIFSCHAENVENYLRNRLPVGNGRYGTFSEVLRLMEERKVKVIVETGTARCGDTNFDGDGGSTIIFGHWAYDHNSYMFSVDNSAKHLQLAKEASMPYLKNMAFALEDSVTFLKNFPLQIDLLYLDSWDYDVNDPIPSQEHNLKEVIAAYDKLTEDSIIMIDDCNVPGGGKGKLAIEYLQKLGWKIHIYRHQVIMLKKI